MEYDVDGLAPILGRNAPFPGAAKVAHTGVATGIHHVGEKVPVVEVPANNRGAVVMGGDWLLAIEAATVFRS